LENRKNINQCHWAGTWPNGQRTVTRGPARGLGIVAPTAHWRSWPTACTARPLARRAAREHPPERSLLSGRESRRGRWRRYHGGGGARLGAGASMAEGSPAGQVGGGGSSPELLADGKGGKTRRRRRSPMRWVLRWPLVSCVGVGKRWKFRRRCTRRKR
jgi:hypothetical protein